MLQDNHLQMDFYHKLTTLLLALYKTEKYKMSYTIISWLLLIPVYEGACVHKENMIAVCTKKIRAIYKEKCLWL